MELTDHGHFCDDRRLAMALDDLAPNDCASVAKSERYPKLTKQMFTR